MINGETDPTSIGQAFSEIFSATLNTHYSLKNNYLPECWEIAHHVPKLERTIFN